MALTSMPPTRIVEVFWEMFYPDGSRVTRSARRLTVYTGGTRHTFTRENSYHAIYVQDFTWARNRWPRVIDDRRWWKLLKKVRAHQARAANVVIVDNERAPGIAVKQRSNSGNLLSRGKATAAREVFAVAGRDGRECDRRGVRDPSASGAIVHRKIATMTRQKEPIKKVIQFDREANGRCYWKLFVRDGPELLPFGQWVTFTREEMPFFAESQGWELIDEPAPRELSTVHKGCPKD